MFSDVKERPYPASSAFSASSRPRPRPRQVALQPLRVIIASSDTKAALRPTRNACCAGHEKGERRCVVSARVIRCFGENSWCDIDFAVFYILPVPSSLSAKWRRVKIGSLTCFLRARPLATASRLGYASGSPTKRDAFLRHIPSCAQMSPRLLMLGLRPRETHLLASRSDDALSLELRITDKLLSP